MTLRKRFAVAMVLLTLAACSLPRERERVVLRPLDSPASAGSGEASLTLAPDGRVLLSWIEPVGGKGNRLRLASRENRGGWSPPLTVAEGADWFVNWADFPSVATLPDGTLFAHWLAKSGAGTYAYDVRVSSSRDAGKTWSAPLIPHRDGTQSEHGFVSLLAWGPREVGIVWLDGRKTAGAGHEATKGAMSLMHATLDGDGRLGPETVLDDRVCDCCQTDAVRTDGATVVVYRDRSEREVRDMSVVRFADGRWSPPQLLARDGWEINGCPVNGPAIAAAGSRVSAVWFTAAGGAPRVKVAFSENAGVTFGSPVVVDDGRPLGRVDVVALDGGAALVSWLEQTEKGTEVRARRVAPDGARGEALTVAGSSEARSSGFPRMVRSQDEITIAWRDAADPPRVRTAVIALGSSNR